MTQRYKKVFASALIHAFENKLECFLLASIFNFCQHLQVKYE
jgi:hypothetical protein